VWEWLIVIAIVIFTIIVLRKALKDMGNNLAAKSLTAGPYIPSSPRTGAEGESLFRLKNIISHGRTPYDYLEVYGGSKDLSETIATNSLSGVIDIGSSSITVNGTLTAFAAQLRPGQIFFFNSAVLGARSLLVVENIPDPATPLLAQTTLTISKRPAASATAQIGILLPVIFDLNRRRGTLEHGNALEFDKGTILCVGQGTLRINGSVLSGTSLVATRKAQLAVFSPTTSTYSVFKLGMNPPTSGFSAAATGSGTKNMQAGTYTLFIVPARQATDGYNNPSPKAEVTITANQRIQLTIPAVDATNGQDAWRIYGSLWTDDVTNINGPWYFIKQITAQTGGDISPSGGTYIIEYNDAEISGNERISFDNDPPPDADFVAAISGYPVYISCQGPGHAFRVLSATGANPGVFTTTTPSFLSAVAHQFSLNARVIVSGGTGSWAAANGIWLVNTIPSTTTLSLKTPAGVPLDTSAFGALSGTIQIALEATSPGPFVVPAKPNNIEAAPLKLATSLSPPESIIGYVAARTETSEINVPAIYLLTANSLQIAELINTEGNPDIPPVNVRPFWRAGFKNPYQLAFVDGILYGFTNQGPTRSLAFGDVGNVEHAFAANVREITDTWTRGHVFVAHDPLNNAVCFFHSDDSTNASNFHTTRVLMFGLERQDWIGDIILESTTGDMFVSGVATVSGRLEFIAGGRQADTSVVFRTYHFDSSVTLDGGAGVSVPYYMAWQFTDDGIELRDKVVKSLSVTAALSSGSTAGIHGAGAEEVINITTLEAGNSGSKSGSIPLVAASSITKSARIPLNVPNLRVWTLRIDGTWPGTGTKDRIDEAVIERAVQGVRN